jgi:hypothetical protein
VLKKKIYLLKFAPFALEVLPGEKNGRKIGNRSFIVAMHAKLRKRKTNTLCCGN